MYVNINSGFILKEDEGFLSDPHYRTQNELADIFAKLSKYFPRIARQFTIGRSLEGQDIIALHINQNIQSRNLLTPMVKYIGNMHGDETIGREMLIYLAEYLLFNYGKIHEVTEIVNTTDLYLVPTMNPDGFSRSKVLYRQNPFNFIIQY